MSDENPLLPYAKAIVELLKGPVYSEQSIWEELLRYRYDIQHHYEQIGLRLIVSETDGYAFLEQAPLDEENNTIGLMRRMPLTYEVSLVCLFLREELDDFDISDSAANRCLIGHEVLVERLELFFKEKPNMKRFFKDLDKHIRKTESLGFLQEVKQENSAEKTYEIKRIIKALISSDQIEAFKQKLEALSEDPENEAEHG